MSGEGGERKQVLKSIENGTDKYMKHSNMFHRPTKDLAGQSTALIRILIISSMEILPRRTPMQNSWSIILKVLSNSVDLMKKLQMGASSKGLALT